MEITGKVHQFLEPESGEGKKGQWVKGGIVVSYMDGKYEKFVAVDVWNEKMQDIRELNLGDEIRVHVNISSREWNDKWFTSVQLWKLEILNGGSGLPY